MATLHFIFNPVAGNGLSKKKFESMRALLDERGIAYTVAVSEYAGHARLLAGEAAQRKPDCIVAVGGDGTVQEVAAAMIGSGIPLGVFPCGTGNDLVRALHIPSDPALALDVLLNGQVRSLDAGEVNGKLFFNVAGLGFDVDVLIYTERYKKRFRGLAAYLLGLLRALTGLALKHVCIRTGEETIECDALVVEVGNGTHFGGGMHVTPLADPCDGLLDVCIIRDITKLTVLRVLSRFVKGKHLDLPCTTYFRATELTVTSDPSSPLQLDGEIMNQTPARFRVLPSVLPVLCGRG